MGTSHRHCRSSHRHPHHHPHHHHHHHYNHHSNPRPSVHISPPCGPRRKLGACAGVVSCLLWVVHKGGVLLLLLSLLSLACPSVSGFSLQSGGSSQCRIDQCSEKYQEDALELTAARSRSSSSSSSSGSSKGGSKEAEATAEQDAHCLALRTYWTCIKGTKNACQGNLRYYGERESVRNKMKLDNCTMSGPTLDSLPPPQRPPVPPHCQYRGKGEFRHCGLFGDPHLRTFGRQFQTCRVKGAWPLVSNDHLTVQVTNHPVMGAQGDATATSKLTVIVKSHPECGSQHYHTYQAQTDSLPAAFEDGSTSYGRWGSVEVREVEPNRHVEISIGYIATTIVVRQIGPYFTFAIHTPQELVNSTVHSHEPELCSKGCPPAEQIDYRQYLAKRRGRVVRLQGQGGGGGGGGGAVSISRDDAEEECRRAGLMDFYFDSCVFDLLSTGDRNFTLAAVSALQDVLRLDPDFAISSRSTLDDETYSGSGGAGAVRVTGGWWWVLVVLWTVWWVACLGCCAHPPTPVANLRTMRGR